jgi:hypothetical protein
MTSSDSDETPELSSLAAVLDDLMNRVSSISGRRVVLDPDDQLANELFEVERLLSGASRRMTRLLRQR